MRDRSSDIAVLEGEPRYKPAVLNGYVPDDIVTNGLVLYIPSWLHTGGTFKSVDSYQHLCTKTGALWTPDGLWYDGIDDKIELNDNNVNSPMNFVASAFSLEFWVKVDVLGPSDYRGIISRGSHIVDGYYLDARESNKLRFSVDRAGVSDGVNFAGFFSTGVWIHGVATKSGANVVIYKNGASFATQGGFGNPTSNARPTRTGIYGNGIGTPMYGTIGEVRIYNRALLAVEVFHNYMVTRWRYGA